MQKLTITALEKLLEYLTVPDLEHFEKKFLSSKPKTLKHFVMFLNYKESNEISFLVVAENRIEAAKILAKKQIIRDDLIFITAEEPELLKVHTTIGGHCIICNQNLMYMKHHHPLSELKDEHIEKLVHSGYIIKELSYLDDYK